MSTTEPTTDRPTADKPFYTSVWFIAAVFGVMVLTGMRVCIGDGKRVKPLSRLYEVPAFTLTDQTGAEYGSEQLRGEVWVASFFFTTCTTICPRVSRAKQALQRELKEAGLDVKLVSITVDPGSDTPEALTHYARTYDADPERWRFLTGDRDTIFKLLVKGFNTAMGDKTDDGGVVDISHSSKLVLVDRDHWIRYYFDSTSEGRRALVGHAGNVVAEERLEGGAP